MRIGIFTESYEPIVNGVSVCVSTLRDELTRRGHDVFAFAPAYGGFVDELDSVFRLPSRHTPLMRDYPFPIPYAPKMQRKFASLNLDIVHTQTPFLLGVLGARWAKQCGVPLVSTNHTLYTEYVHYAPIRPKVLTKAFLIWLMKWYYTGCSAVVVPSVPVEEILRSYGIKTRIEIIKTGIDCIKPLASDERDRLRLQYGVKESDFLLLYVGRIAREKNLQMLLRAYKKVASEHANIRLLLVGGGPALGETKRFASGLGITDRLEFLGMLPRQDIAPIYCAADAFAFPSTTETQGIAICEALSAGLPVVAVNAGGIPENIQQGIDGFLTQDNADEFAERISYLLMHENERKEMSERAKVNACGFSTGRMVNEFEQFYASVIESCAAKKL